MNTVVKRYKNDRRFAKDAPRMAARGYTVASTFQGNSKNRPLRNLIKTPFGTTLLWGSSSKGGRIVATYTYTPPMQPMMSPGMMPMMDTPRRQRQQRRSFSLLRLVALTLFILLVAPVLLTILAHAL